MSSVDLKTNFLEESEQIISQLKSEINKNKAREILNHIMDNYKDQLDFTVEFKNCIPFRSKKSKYKSVTITEVQDRLLLHFPKEEIEAGYNLLSIFGVPAIYDPFSETQVDVKLEDITEIRLVEHAIDYAFRNLR